MMESDAEVEANEAKARRLRARAELARAEADLLESEMRLKEVKRKRYALENGQAVKLWVGKVSPSLCKRPYCTIYFADETALSLLYWLIKRHC